MSEPRRLHPASVILLALRVARELAIPALLPVALSLFNRGLGGIDARLLLIIALAAIVVVIVSAGFGVLSWRRFTYAVAGGELRVDSGVVNRQRRSIPFERIQAVDLAQTPLQRALGIVSVRVETAGGGSGRPEVSLPGVARADAEWLRRAVAERHPREVDAGGTAAPSLPSRRLSVADLLLAGSTGGRAGVALSIVAALATFADDLLPLGVVEDVSGQLDGARALAVLGLLLAALIWLLGLAGTVLAYAGFSIALEGDHLLIERGLLDRRRATIPVNRIQAVRIVEGLVRQPLGLVELRVESAGFGSSAGESTVFFPLLRRREVLPFLAALAPAFAVTAELARPPSRAQRRYATRFSLLLPAALLALGPAILFYPTGIVALAFVPLAAALGLWQYVDAGWAVTGDTLLLRWRTLGRSTVIMPRRRTQLASTRQTIFQARAGLATFVARVASGKEGAEFELRHLDAADAQGLRDWSARRGY